MSTTRLSARLFLIAVGSSLLITPRSYASAPSPIHALSSLDRQQAAFGAHLAGQSATRAAGWLRRRSDVRSVQIQRDAVTIKVSFRDGASIFVLPRTVHPLKLAPQPLTRLRTLQRKTPSLDRAGATSGRAIVLEPFATELNYGPNAGQTQVDALTKVGFKVDVARNAAVTVKTMETLADYSVVYLETHAGLLDNGDALVVTGESNAAPYKSLYDDKSLQQALVAGDASGTVYNAITSKFVLAYMGVFPNSSIVFLNGCSMLSAPLFWTDLHSKHVATMISWDHEVYNSVDGLAADSMLADLAKGDTVVGATQVTRAAGLGTSIVDGVTAHLGFEGDGANTLARALAGITPAAPSVTPTATPHPAPKAVACKRGWHTVHGKCRRIVKCKGGFRLVHGKCRRT
jgi:hypothetical protein